MAFRHGFRSAGRGIGRAPSGMMGFQGPPLPVGIPVSNAPGYDQNLALSGQLLAQLKAQRAAAAQPAPVRQAPQVVQPSPQDLYNSKAGERQAIQEAFKMLQDKQGEAATKIQGQKDLLDKRIKGTADLQTQKDTAAGTRQQAVLTLRRAGLDQQAAEKEADRQSREDIAGANIDSREKIAAGVQTGAGERQDKNLAGKREAGEAKKAEHDASVQRAVDQVNSGRAAAEARGVKGTDKEWSDFINAKLEGNINGVDMRNPYMQDQVAADLADNVTHSDGTITRDATMKSIRDALTVAGSASEGMNGPIPFASSTQSIANTLAATYGTNSSIAKRALDKTQALGKTWQDRAKDYPAIFGTKGVTEIQDKIRKSAEPTATPVSGTTVTPPAGQGQTVAPAPTKNPDNTSDTSVPIDPETGLPEGQKRFTASPLAKGTTAAPDTGKTPEDAARTALAATGLTVSPSAPASAPTPLLNPDGTVWHANAEGVSSFLAPPPHVDPASNSWSQPLSDVKTEGEPGVQPKNLAQLVSTGIVDRGQALGDALGSGAKTVFDAPGDAAAWALRGLTGAIGSDKTPDQKPVADTAYRTDEATPSAYDQLNNNGIPSYSSEDAYGMAKAGKLKAGDQYYDENGDLKHVTQYDVGGPAAPAPKLDYFTGKPITGPTLADLVPQAPRPDEDEDAWLPQ